MKKKNFYKNKRESKMKHPHKRGGSCALAQKKNVVFVTFICVLFQCMAYRINFQNTYTFTYPKTLFHRLFLVFKIFQCILTSSSENNPLTLNPSPIAFPQINAPALDFGAWSAALIGGQNSKEGDAYLKVREIISEKFQDFVN